MNNNNTTAGTELLFLLRQQRYLYHQLKILTDRQHKTIETNSPELMLEIVSGRRKLIEKLRGLDDKFKPIKTNWQKISTQIGPEYKAQVQKIKNETKEIIEKISSVSTSETIQNLPLDPDLEFDELLAGI